MTTHNTDKKHFRAVAPLRSVGVPTVESVRDLFGPAKTAGGQPSQIRAAQDAALMPSYDLLQHNSDLLGALRRLRFLGYGILSSLTQNGLIRAGVEMLADEMTRKFVDIGTTGEGDADQAITALKKAFDKYDIKTLFRNAAAQVGYFGGCLVYIDTGETDPGTLRTPLYLDSQLFKPGKLKGFKLIEPFNVSPGLYNSTNPLRPDYYKPRTWWVHGVEVDASRFLYFSGAEVPTLLKPSYNFFGVPTSQIVLDVVQHFDDCREAAARLLKKFSLTVLKTDMSGVMAGDADTGLRARVQYFVQNRDNDGVQVIDGETEDIVKLETPLSGVTDIVRQSMEMVAAYFSEPTVKLWGISPGGFNATGESDMQNHYDHVASQQSKIFDAPLKRLLDVLQMNEMGQIDQSIVATYLPIGNEDIAATATAQKTKADTDALYLDRGILSQAEVRQRLANDERSGYSGIDVDAAPDTPEPGADPDLDAMLQDAIAAGKAAAGESS